MARKNILVTGAAGYIGSHIALCCLLSGEYSVVTIDNFSNSFPTAMTRVSKLAVEALPADASDEEKKACQIDVVKGDITVKSDIEKIFEAYKAKGGIWGVIHVAALKAVGESAEKPIQYYEANITATINLLDVMARHQVYNIVYSSSATVYGAPQQIPIPETSVLAPESVYGRTKHMSELIIKDVCDSNPDTWRAIGLRYFNPAGAHPSGEIGEDPRGKPGNLLPLLAQMAVGKFAKEGLKIFGHDYPTPDGTCVRDYIHGQFLRVLWQFCHPERYRILSKDGMAHPFDASSQTVMDLAQGHVDALAALTRESTYASLGTQKSQFGGSGGKYKAYNLGKGKGMSVLQMVEAMRVASGFEYKYEIVGRRVGDVPDLTADPALAEKEMGFKAPRNLQEMCRDQWNWQSKNPKGYEGQEE